MSLQEEIEGLKIESRTEEGHTGSTFYGSYKGQGAVVKCLSNDEVIREKEALEIVEGAKFRTPEVLDFRQVGDRNVLVTEMIKSEFPSRAEWENPDFCMNLASSAANVLNYIHSEPLNEKARGKEYCSGNRKRAINSMERKNYKIREEVGGRIAQMCEEITYNIRTEHAFTHGDFSTENILISEGEIEAVIDWADCGFTSRLRDIALFEASFIDEYIRFFHPKKHRKIRRTFREELERDVGEKLELYRFHQNAVILAYIRRGNCSDEWLKTGTESEIIEHRKKLLKEDRRKVAKILG